MKLLDAPKWEKTIAFIEKLKKLVENQIIKEKEKKDYGNKDYKKMEADITGVGIGYDFGRYFYGL